MKQLYIAFLLFVLLPQVNGQNNFVTENLMPSEWCDDNRQISDTLWVWDSIPHYVLDQNGELNLQYTYKVVERDEIGDKYVSQWIPSDEFLGSTIASRIDSVLYFDDRSIKRSSSAIYDVPSELWKNSSLLLYEEPDLLSEKTYKFYSNALHEFTGGTKESYQNSDGLRRVIHQSKYNKLTDEWYDFIRTDLSYDENGNDTLHLSKVFTNNQWIDTLKVTRTFDSGKLTDYLTYYYNKQTSDWIPRNKYHYHYNSEDLSDTVTQQSWNEETMVWDDEFSSFTSYDEFGREVLVIVRIADYFTGEMTNYLTINTVYSTDSKTILYLNWNSIDSEWINQRKTMYSYIADGQTDSITEYNWNSLDNIWMYNYRDVMQYDERLLQQDQTRYVYTQNEWKITTRDVFYWSAFLPNGIEENNTYLVSVYPNPTSGILNFKTNNKSNKMLSIYDVFGKLISNQMFDCDTFSISCESFKTGCYFYSVESGGIKQTGKFIVR